jgi:hypothetical protein
MAHLNLQILLNFRNLRFSFGLLFLETTTEGDQKIVTFIKKTVFNSNIYEAFLESAPQFILQCSIVLRTGNISKLVVNLVNGQFGIETFVRQFKWI